MERLLLLFCSREALVGFFLASSQSVSVVVAILGGKPWGVQATCYLAAVSWLAG